MKILTGSLKGRNIPFYPGKGPHDELLRPTSDKVRKAIFDTLREFVSGENVLDLYSGTGAMGLEALSQEAAFVVFVEKERERAERIRKTTEEWGLSGRAEIFCQDAFISIKKLKSSQRNFGLIFADPPYGDVSGVRILTELLGAELILENGFVVVETGKREDLPEKIRDLIRIRDKKYGQTRIAIFQRQPQDRRDNF